MATSPKLLTAGTEEHDLTRLDEYVAVNGYTALSRARDLEPQALMDEVSAATLRGRGGAGFPMGRKASLLAKDTGQPIYLVVNADESEPGAFKDRDVMRFTPHRLIEGCLITAHGIGSQSVFIYIRGEYLHEFEVMRAALEDARKADLLGDVTIVLHRGAGAYICGEETALLESLEGQRGQPRPRPPFPPVNGLYGAPTQINNVSTIALVPKIVELGAAEFAKIGVPSAPGTAVFSLSGNVAEPGNYERPLGTTLRELIYDVAGGVAGGHELKAVIPGGSSVPVLTPAEIDTPMDYDSIQAAGSFFGSAAIIVVDERCCMVQLALRAEQFYMHESCGKCTPCRVGTRWLVQLLKKIEEGHGEATDLDLLQTVCDRMLGRSLCALGDFAVYPVASYLRKYRAEFQAHIDGSGCPFEGESSIEGIFAPVDQHVHPVPEVARV
ncbi:MAG: NADH-quinone oxidoreductase subunit NuoF [Actinobacteria bacterium]|nr:NADH-quinone oxidoreductase subunit NuoF [Actinomycetota bacterium]